MVGPNGSGKSNVVDALSWVMGEQGAKTLRGGKMEDVIFAGTSGRPPLGRAHVSLTIDNSDGALPIDYSEVTISRTLFRTGGSEYAINGAGCRLLDIQELLSDSGLGREMHVIVGKASWDKVLHATRRTGAVSSRRPPASSSTAAARKRRSASSRPCRPTSPASATSPEKSGASSPRWASRPRWRARAQMVQFEVRDARSRLLADDLVQLQSVLEHDVADETALKARRGRVERELESGRQRQAGLEQLAAEATPKLNAARDNWYQLSQDGNGCASLGSLAEERRRLLGAADAAPDAGRDPRAAGEAGGPGPGRPGRAGSGHYRAARRAGRGHRRQAGGRKRAAAEDRRLATLLRAAADRREGLARLAGQVGAARSRVESPRPSLAG